MKKSAALVLLALSLSLSGCWDYLELEFIDFVLGIGVDEIEPSFTIVTEVIKVSGFEEPQFVPVVLTTRGATFFSSKRSLEKVAGIRLFWAHAQVLIVSEEVARIGILPAVEFVIRDPDVRTSVSVFVTKDCLAEEIFKSKPPITISVSDHLLNTMEFHRRIPTFFMQELWQFREALQRSGIEAVLPTVRLVQEGAEQVPVLEGTALFRGQRMVGWIDGQETRIFSLLRDVPDRGPLVVRTQLGGEQGQVTYEIRGNQVKIEPILDQKLKFSLTLQLEVDLRELDALSLDYEKTPVLAALEREIEAFISSQIKHLLEKVQKEFSSDIFGFGLLLKRKDPRIWSLYEKDWNRVFRDLEVAVHVQSRIAGTGILSRPMVRRD